MTKLSKNIYRTLTGFYLGDCLADMRFTLTAQTFGWSSSPIDGLPISEAKVARASNARKTLQLKLAIIRYQRYIGVAIGV